MVNYLQLETVWKSYIFNMWIGKNNWLENAYLVIDECTIIWKKARIPNKNRTDCMKKFKKSYEIFQSLGKCKKRESETYKS